MRAWSFALVIVLAVGLAGCERRDRERFGDCGNVSWHPNGLAPVFHGYRDYGPATGAPGPVRVFFPSTDTTPAEAQPLDSCGPYPVILFAHGQCHAKGTLRPGHHLDWSPLGAQLARAGYVVALPELGYDAYPWETPDPDQERLNLTYAWLRSGWESRSLLEDARLVGAAGHSYGAMKAAVWARDARAWAYAGLGAGWDEWPDAPRRPIYEISPALHVVGRGDHFATIADDAGRGRFARVPPVAHAALLGPMDEPGVDEVAHWDYLEAPVPCRDAQSRGSCLSTPALTRDLVTLFFTKHMPSDAFAPRPSPSAAERIPTTLVPAPRPALTPEQERYAEGWLASLSTADASACRSRVLAKDDMGSVSGVWIP